MAFKVGQKVVNHIQVTGICPYGKDKGYRVNKIPKLGNIYTVHEIDNGYICLSELKYSEKGIMMFFNAMKFRPLDYDFVEKVIKQVTPKEVEA